MPKVAIVTDSVVSIPESGKEVLRDLVTIQREAFYEWLPTAQKLPLTASPGPGDYLEMYEKLVNEEAVNEIVSIHMTSKGSGAYQAAKTAQAMIKDKLPGLKVEVVDTLNVSMCHGWMVIEAARASLQGGSLNDIVNIVKNMIPSTHMLQTADTLKYLYMGGRIGKAKHLMGTLLNIKPLIGMEDGVIVPLGQARSRKKAYQLIVDRVDAAVGEIGKIKVAYVHAAAYEEAEKIKALLETRLDCVESIIAELSPALGVHTGPGTAGVCYFPVEK